MSTHLIHIWELVARTLLGAPGLTRNKKLLGTRIRIGTKIKLIENSSETWRFADLHAPLLTAYQFPHPVQTNSNLVSVWRP